MADRIQKTCGFCKRRYWVELETEAGQLVEVGECKCTRRRLARLCQVCAKSIADMPRRVLYCPPCRVTTRKRDRLAAELRYQARYPEANLARRKRYRRKNRERIREYNRRYQQEYLRKYSGVMAVDPVCKACGKSFKIQRVMGPPKFCRPCFEERYPGRTRYCDGEETFRHRDRRELSCVDCQATITYTGGGVPKRCRPCNEIWRTVGRREYMRAYRADERAPETYTCIDCHQEHKKGLGKIPMRCPACRVIEDRRLSREYKRRKKQEAKCQTSETPRDC
jgi:hypothetical protein